MTETQHTEPSTQSVAPVTSVIEALVQTRKVMRLMGSGIVPCQAVAQAAVDALGAAERLLDGASMHSAAAVFRWGKQGLAPAQDACGKAAMEIQESIARLRAIGDGDREEASEFNAMRCRMT